MNVNPLVISALASLGPVYPNVCPVTPLPDEYLTLNYVDERPNLVADGEDIAEETTIRINYFTKGNPQNGKKQIRWLLRGAGFNVLSTGEIYEQETGYTHVYVEAALESLVND